MSDSLSWIHLTDVHFGQANPWMWSRMRQQLYADLALVLDKCKKPWDVVFFSGDFVQSGEANQYLEAEKELIMLWGQFRKLGANPLLIPIPGNHDLVRPQSTAPLVRQSLRWHDDSERLVYDDFWENAQSYHRQEVAWLFTNYNNWLSRSEVPKPELKTGLLPGDFSTIISVGTSRVGVIGLNSTFLQAGDGAYEKKLDIHTSQLLQVCPNPDEWRRGVDVAVLLTHQPSSWLHPIAHTHYIDICRLAGIDFHLCGHMHEANMIDFSVGGSPTFRMRQGTSLFGLEKSAAGIDRIFGYSSGIWSVGDSASEKIWPRRANKSYSGGLNIGPDVGYELNSDLCVVSSLQLRHNRNCLKAELSIAAFNAPATIVSIDERVSPEAAKSKLKNLPVAQLYCAEQHQVIRLQEKERFNKVLAASSAVWLVSDWGLGKLGFLGSVKAAWGEEVDVFSVQCGGVDDCDALQVACGVQFGMSFQDFFAAVAMLPKAILILDDLPSSILLEAEGREFESLIIKPLLDFCPNLKLILIVRQKPDRVRPEDVVTLSPLDIYETRDYLRNHAKAQSGLDDPDILERIHKWSGGLPMQLDKLLEDMQVFSLSEILDEDASEDLSGGNLEPVPRALREAVALLKGAEDERGKRSFELLKVLTVLRDGETFQSIKRFYGDKPFHLVNVSDLTNLALVDAIPISQESAEVSLRFQRKSYRSVETSKLLRVPRQVRDYVNTLIDENERRDIYQAATRLLFGPVWWRGRIRLRNGIFNSYSLSSLAGPGNEHFVAKYLLSEALRQENTHAARRAVRVGVGLCSRLFLTDRFRDAVIACSAMVSLLRGTAFVKEFAEASLTYSRALRMVDRFEESVEAAKIAIDSGRGVFTDDANATAYLNIAYALKSLEDKEGALEAAEMVISISEVNSSHEIQARSIMVEISSPVGEIAGRLVELHSRARNYGRITAANNIALRLAKLGAGGDDSLRLLDQVMRTAPDNYNRTRAIIDKANLLSGMNRAGDLNENDRSLLSAAYAYSYSQRINDLLNKCHQSLWEIYKNENHVPQLLRLFRFSSFIWRLIGRVDDERRYLRELDNMRIDEVKRSQGVTLHFELIYVERRRETLP